MSYYKTNVFKMKTKTKTRSYPKSNLLFSFFFITTLFVFINHIFLCSPATARAHPSLLSRISSLFLLLEEKKTPSLSLSVKDEGDDGEFVERERGDIWVLMWH